MASSIIKSQTAINQIIERTLLDGSCILVRIAPSPKRTKKMASSIIILLSSIVILLLTHAIRWVLHLVRITPPPKEQKMASSIIKLLSIIRIKFRKNLGPFLHEFKHMFLIFKQHYTYFHTLFYSHISPKKLKTIF